MRDRCGPPDGWQSCAPPRFKFQQTPLTFRARSRNTQRVAAGSCVRPRPATCLLALAGVIRRSCRAGPGVLPGPGWGAVAVQHLGLVLVQAVVVPSGFSMTVQPCWWMTTWWWYQQNRAQSVTLVLPPSALWGQMVHLTAGCGLVAAAGEPAVQLIPQDPAGGSRPGCRC